MSFGFSVGDVISCSKLAFNAYHALKDAPKEFEGLRLEVLSLNATLRALAEEANSPNSIILLASSQRQESLRVLLENCSKGLEQLQVLTKKFPSLGANEKVKFLEHVKFSFQNKNSPRDKLAIHTASINIFLTSLTHSSLGRLEGLIKNALRGTQQKQQGFQTQPSTAGFENLGPRSFTAFTNAYGGAPQPEQAEKLDVWRSIEQDLEWEAIRAQDVQPHKDEIVAYIRYLHNGGEPFWRRSGAKLKEDERSQRQTSQPQSYVQERYRREKDSQPLRQAPPPAYSPPVPADPKPAFGGAVPTRPNPRPPPARLVSQAPPSGPPIYGRNTAPTNSRPDKPPPFSFSQPASRASTPPPAIELNTKRLELEKDSSALKGSIGQTEHENREDSTREDATREDSTREDSTREDSTREDSNQRFPSAQEVMLDEQRSRLEQKPETLKLADKKTKHEPSSVGWGSTAGSSQASAFASSGAGASSSQTGHYLDPYGGRANDTTSGSLFGAAPAPAPANESGGLFGNAAPSSASGGLFGAAPPQQLQQAGGLFGSNPGSLFGQAPMNIQEVNDMADLFDHIFDVDEAETAIAQGAELEEPLYEQSYEPSYEPLSPAQPAHHLAVIRPYQQNQIVEREPIPPPLNQHTPLPRALPPAITPYTPVELQRARARDVKVQLQILLEQLYTAYRVGDLRTPVQLLTPTANHLDDSPIRLRVAYLRSAGAIVVNCDLCLTPVEDYHWHCDVCADGDWDCCFRCRNHGKGCPGGHQYLSRRSARNWEKERYWTNL